MERHANNRNVINGHHNQTVSDFKKMNGWD